MIYYLVVLRKYKKIQVYGFGSHENLFKKKKKNPRIKMIKIFRKNPQKINVKKYLFNASLKNIL